MKLRIIGTGSMSSISNSASYLIDDMIAVDMPNGFCKNVKKIGIEIENINNVLVTHFHGDHYFDIPFYLLALSKKENSKTNIYINKNNKKKIKKIFKLAFPNSVKKIEKNVLINYIDEKHFKINDYKIEKILVEHGNLKPAFGYILQYKTKKIGFTGDSCYCDAIENMASLCDYLVCDCSLKEGNNKHMGIDNILELASKYPSHKFIVSHMSDATRKKMIEVKLENIIVPNDYDLIEI